MAKTFKGGYTKGNYVRISVQIDKDMLAEISSFFPKESVSENIRTVLEWGLDSAGYK